MILSKEKTTLPYIYLHDALDMQDKERLKSLHGQALSKEEQMWIYSNIKKYEIIEKCYFEAKELVLEA